MASPSDEIRRLQDCLNGLLSLVVVPALWSGKASGGMMRALLEMLARTLNLELAFARLDDGSGGAVQELACSERHADATRRAHEIGVAIEPWLRDQQAGESHVVPNPLAPGELHVTYLRLGLRQGGGFVLAGARRPGFPADTDLLLLRVAVNQAVVELHRAQALAASRRAESAEAHNMYLREESQQHWGAVVGSSTSLARALALVEQVAPTNASVLIQGETGTGKELIARAIHRLSRRRHHAFVRLNCAAMPAGLLEAELFGHEKGAFTGAVARRIGRFELADRGTIFLDEVGEIPLDLQAKLLHVLQEREFERLGSTDTRRIDVRVIAASNRDLAQMVEARSFREDLYYRLNVFPIEIPPLRERGDDIPVLARHFVQLHARANKRSIAAIDPAGLAALCRYPWPGNVRELSNIIERCVILTHGSTLRVPADALRSRAPAVGVDDSLDAVQRQHILQVLDDCNWVIAGPGGAAARLGMKRTSLQYRLQKLGIVRRR
ncbi:MAG: sigma 54-interacting transcriptional regulator [Pseudomonadota bacterium]|nr:sigma 54-interacting transcriptional regulator [Pseudomonadota bacterium]MDQ8001557.1 sigma 54-interacting transcriptional regulator [Pseudomonadota bacterium]MDQ8015524.1 sigma 54-interacting transcriptional regulator [Pseudomonadota bacterium]